MQDDLLFVLKKVGSFLIFAAIVSAFQLLLFIDVRFLHDSVNEISLTEISQEIILFAIVVLHLWLIRVPAHRAVNVLVGGFFTCLLVREMDFAFDVIQYGSWFWVAMAVCVLCVAVAALDYRRTLAGLADYFRHPGYGLVCAGLLTVLVFSRLMGMGGLWQALLQDAYVRTVKNAVEEGGELFGYVLCLLGTLLYMLDKRNMSRPD
ncbi:hypothetical protein GTU79_09120 [Sodalis ligni]|uniref:hypothetical protein n=1 Tax=Sodalis ligni TaxID=2697027 RepID=UPI001048B5E7|nr:hypothetical protein [Sodalis ligni]QWA12814.1 hypothetical protein GTU79_09120 [Sodalis ligni]